MIENRICIYFYFLGTKQYTKKTKTYLSWFKTLGGRGGDGLQGGRQEETRREERKHTIRISKSVGCAGDYTWLVF